MSGFFNRIKNFVTGGGVEMTLQINNECYLRKPFDVELKMQVDNAAIEAELIYIDLKYIESVEVQVTTHSAQGHSQSRTVRKNSVLYEDRIFIEQDFVLEADQDYTYVNTIQLPLEAMPSFDGIHSKLIWSLQAFIQKSGNDPESEVLVFEPLYEIL